MAIDSLMKKDQGQLIQILKVWENFPGQVYIRKGEKMSDSDICLYKLQHPKITL